jgi:hypothetical protein
MFVTLKEIYSRPIYVVLTLFIFITTTTFALIAANLSFVGSIYSNFGLVAGFRAVFSLLGSISTNFTLFSATSIILLAFFFGVNSSLFVFYFKRYKRIKTSGGAASSTGGLLLGAFGIGCASCGPLIIAPVLSVIGISGLLTFLPFGGEEFLMVGLLLLIYSTYALLKKINEPMTCPIKN